MPKINAYQKFYRLRLAQGTRKNSIEVTFPYEVIDKEARRKKITVKEFINKYQAVAQYNGFNGVLYTFEEITRNGR
jgi:hypothetical protein